jgi:hypothetical protein
MSKDKKHDWAKEKPHDAKTGEITTRRYAENHPNKVEWVKDKKKK